MGDLNYVRDLPDGQFYYDDDQAVMTQEVFDRIADYSRSQPTGPSAGRIYKKNLHWSGPPANWFVYVCREPKDDEDPEYIYHDARPVKIASLGAVPPPKTGLTEIVRELEDM